jgi:hypothetical protein
MQKKRAAFYFDGFNLYHALDALRQAHLKWLSLHGLGDLLIPSRDVFDVYYLVSADTDLAPAIRLLKREFPQKEFVSVATPRRQHSSEFLRLADRTLKITENALAKCLVPAGLAGKDGKAIVRPPQYDPPKGASR